MKFGVIIFGFNWGMYIIFIPFVFNMSLVDGILKISSDSLWVILSYYFSASLENLLVKKNETISTKRL